MSPTRVAFAAVILVIMATAVWEIVTHVRVRANVPDKSDWIAAANVVRQNRAERDLVVSVPEWTDPLLRWAMAGGISTAAAGRSDMAGFERLWLLSIRGAEPPDGTPAGQPEFDRLFGKVRLRRWSLPESPVLYDFTDHVTDARVTLTHNGKQRDCPLKDHKRFKGGGLGKGPMRPTKRFVCDRKKDWKYVGETVLIDIDMKPRRCIWQRVLRPEPITATFEDVPLGSELVFYGGHYDRDERHRKGGPVTAAVSVDGKPLGTMIHNDGEGWKRASFKTSGAESATVSVEVTGDDHKKRGFCWAATTRK